MSTRQIDEWKGFEAFATVALTPQQLTERAGVEFRSSYDDLDVLLESAFAGDRGTVFGLIHHEGAPVPGTDILAHKRDLWHGTEALLDEALDALKLSGDNVRWVSDALPSTPAEHSSRVFISLHWDPSDGPSPLDSVIDTLAKEGLESVVVTSSETDHWSHEVPSMLSKCRALLVISSHTNEWLSYELGAARALRKPAVLMRVGHKKGLRIKFDHDLRIRSFRTHKWFYRKKKLLSAITDVPAHV